MAIALLVAGCSAGSLTLDNLKDEAILTADIPGMSDRRITEERSGDWPSLTQFGDVAGDWTAASVALANAVRLHGWTVTSVNCVGTGNDVIAKKEIGGTWVLLESGAGTRGAGIILRRDPSQQPPGAFGSEGRCPAALLEAAR